MLAIVEEAYTVKQRLNTRCVFRHVTSQPVLKALCRVLQRAVIQQEACVFHVLLRESLRHLLRAEESRLSSTRWGARVLQRVVEQKQLWTGFARVKCYTPESVDIHAYIDQIFKLTAAL